MKCCLLTRFFYEDPHIDFYIEHYLKLGFCKIIILKMDKVRYSINKKYQPYVEFYYTDNHGDCIFGDIGHLLKNSNCDWGLVADSDEYLVINNKYKSIQEFINEKISKFPEITGFYFRWGIINRFDNLFDNDFEKIQQKYKLFDNEHIKTMVKISNFKKIKSSHICHVEPYNFYIDNKVTKHESPWQKVVNNSYDEAFLLHIHTRSINDIIIKSLNTVFEGKQIKNKKNFIHFINHFDENIEGSQLISQFKNLIGGKATIPYLLCTASKIKKPLNLLSFCYENTVTNMEQEDKLIRKILKDNNIIVEKYFLFIEKMNKYMIENKQFLDS